VNALPELRDAQQLHRLRSLRVQRAREQVAAALPAVDAAAAAIQARQRTIERGRHQIDALAHALVHGLAPRLPRWSATASAHLERLADRLERDEYALIGEQRRLEEAQEAVQRARAELTRALAREDAVGGLVDETRRARASRREQRVESELEDQAPRAR
jgi:hypothetical protein